MAKWQNYSFRFDNSGFATGANDPVGEDTNAQFVGGNYPVAGVAGGDGKSFGKLNVAAASGGNYSNNAGDPLIAGGHAVSSAGQHYQIDKDAGSYDFRCAFGANTSYASHAAVFIDGTLAQFNADIGVSLAAGGIFVWAVAKAWSVNDVAVMSDLSVWRCSVAGTGGTVEPSGTGPFSDGGATFVKTPRVALVRIPPTATSTGTPSVVDQNGAVVTVGTWKTSATKTIIITSAKGSALTLVRVNGSNMYPRQVSLKAQPVTLSGVTLDDEYGSAQGIMPTLFANQPANLALFRINVPAGASTASALALSGTLAGYFSVQTIDGRPWLVTSSTRLPDSAAGSASLVITQTDANGTNSPYQTTLTCNVISSQGRPTDSTIYGRITTENWLNRALVESISKTGAPFQGYASQTFASDTAVYSKATFQTALANIPSGGSGWHRIRLQNGNYDGRYATAINKDLRLGGLLIEPDAGHDPDFTLALSSLCIANLHCRGFKSRCDAIKGSSSYQWNFPDRGAGQGYHARAIFENMRFGILHPTTSYALSDVPNVAGFAVNMPHGEQLWITGCDFWGAGGGVLMSGVRHAVFENNELRQCDGDVVRFINALNPSSTQGVFTDNNIYVWDCGNIWHQAIDFTGYSNGAHRDRRQQTAFQTPTGSLTMYDIFPSSGGSTSKGDNLTSTTPANWAASTSFTVGQWIQTADLYNSAWRVTVAGTSSSTQPVATDRYNPVTFVDGSVTWTRFFPYAVGSYAINMNAGSNGRIYKVASRTTGVTGGTPPTATTSGIADGGVTWDYWGDNTKNTNSDQYYHSEGNIVHDASSLSPNGPDIQMFGNFSLNRGSKIYFSCFNEIAAGTSSYGYNVGRGKAWIEFTTGVGAADLCLPNSMNKKGIFPTVDLQLRDRANVVGQLPPTAGTPTNRTGAALVSFTYPGTVGTRPGDVLLGTFTNNTAYYTYTSITDNGSSSLATFRTALANHVRATAAGIGHQL